MYSSGIGSYLLHLLIDIYYLNYVMMISCHKNETQGYFAKLAQKNWLQIFFFDFKQLRRTSVQKKIFWYARLKNLSYLHFCPHVVPRKTRNAV